MVGGREKRGKNAVRKGHGTHGVHFVPRRRGPPRAFYPSDFLSHPLTLPSDVTMGGIAAL